MDNNMARQKWPGGTWMKVKDPARLKQAIKDRGMSLQQVAEHAGCTKAFISHLLPRTDPLHEMYPHPRKTTCSDEVAERIAELLGVPSTDLFEPRRSIDGRRIVVPRQTAARTSQKVAA